MHLIVTLNFIAMYSSKSKYSGGCIQVNEVFVLLYSDWNCCIMTERTCI